MRQTVGILGTPIDILDTEAVLARLDQFIQERRFHQVATANTDFLINALADPELRYILRNADLVMPDGMPVVWAARLVRTALPERVTGADIVPELAKLAAAKGYTIYMLGASEEVAQRAKERLETDNPGLKIVGCISPPVVNTLVEMDSEDILQDIERVQPDVLLVAFGNPKQEKWIHLHRDRLCHVPVCIGVGGTFDFLAGKVPRAPMWMQRGGMEWFHRLTQEPRRLWKRYVRDIFQFSRFLFKQWLAVRKRKSSGDYEIHEAQMADCTVLSIVGDFDARMMSLFQRAADSALSANKHLILDLQRVETFDGSMLGTLINLNKRAAYCNRKLTLVALSPAMKTALRRSQVHDERFLISDTLAEAFTNSRQVGLYWQTLQGEDAAVITVSGTADLAAVQNLEKTCLQLLQVGKRIDLDLRDLIYADSYLIAALFRLRCAYRVDCENDPPLLRLVLGEVLRAALKRARLMERFTLIEAPETPPDALDDSVEICDGNIKAPPRNGSEGQPRNGGSAVEDSVEMPEDLPPTIDPKTLYVQGAS